MRFRMVHGRQLAKELVAKAKKDQITMGAAAVAFYSMLALFPLAIFVLTLLPYLPIPHLEQAVMDLVHQAMPGDAANVFTETVKDIVVTRRAGLVSFGFLFTLWASSNGMYAVIRQLDVVHEVEETRSFLRIRLRALVLTIVCALLLLGALSLAVFGGEMQRWLGDTLGWSKLLLAFFAALRWVVIAAASMLALAVAYRFGPNVRRKFAFVTPGTVAGTAALAVGAIAFNLYVGHFASYDKVYGSLGAVIVMLLWLFVTGLGFLLGAEVDVLAERGRAPSYGRETRGRHGVPTLGTS